MIYKKIRSMKMSLNICLHAFQLQEGKKKQQNTNIEFYYLLLFMKNLIVVDLHVS